MLLAGQKTMNIPGKFVRVTGLTSTAIRAAIDSLGTAGGTVYMPAGTYTITSTINLPADREVHIVGGGIGATKLQLVDGSNIICFQQGSSGKPRSFSDFEIDGSLQETQESTGIRLYNASGGSYFKNIMIHNISGTTGTPYGGDGIHFAGACVNVVIDACQIYAVGDDCIDCLSGGSMERLRIVNCQITGAGDNGIDTDYCIESVFANNVIRSCGGSGIEIESEGTNLPCLNNTVVGNAVRLCAVGVLLSSARSTTVTGNAISECTTAGILLNEADGNNDPADYNTVGNNVLYDNEYGILEVNGEADHNIFIGNQFYGSDTADYLLYGTYSHIMHSDASGLFTNKRFDCELLQARQIIVDPVGQLVPIKVIRGTDSSPVADAIQFFENDGTTKLFSMDMDGRIRVAQESTDPVVTPLAQLTADGGSGTYAGSDSAGKLTINIGSPVTTGAILSMAFSKSFTTAPAVILTAGNAASDHLQHFFATSTLAGWVFNIGAVTGWTINTTYIYNVIVLGGL